MSRKKESPVTSALVGDLESFTSEQIESTLDNVDVSFTCKSCGAYANTLVALVDHIVGGSCTGEQVQQEDEVQAGDVLCVGTAEVQSSPEPVSRLAENPSSRVTRISSGSIRRRSAIELLGLSKSKKKEATPGKTTRKETSRQRKLDSEDKDYVPIKPRKQRKIAKDCTDESDDKAVVINIQESSVSAILKQHDEDTKPNSEITQLYLKPKTEIEGIYQEANNAEVAVRTVYQNEIELKVKQEDENKTAENEIKNQCSGIVKRKRGRPRKIKPEGEERMVTDTGLLMEVHSVRDKKKRVRLKPTSSAGQIQNEDYIITQNWLEDPEMGSGVMDVQETEKQFEADYSVDSSASCIRRKQSGQTAKGKPGRKRRKRFIEFFERVNKRVPYEHRCLVCRWRSFPKLEELDLHLSCHTMLKKKNEDESGHLPKHAEPLQRNETVRKNPIEEEININKSEVDHSSVNTAVTDQNKQNLNEHLLMNNKMLTAHITDKENDGYNESAVDNSAVDGGLVLEQVREAVTADVDDFSCPICPYECTNWNRMLSHLITHDLYMKMLKGSEILKNIYGDFPCPICHKSFEKKYNMMAHYNKIHFKQNKVCEVCGKTLNSVDEKTFIRHLEKCRNILKKCPFCYYKTPVSANLRKHVKIHTGKGFTCEHCQAVFPTRQRYAVHKETHLTNRPVVYCKDCSHSFKTKDALKKHTQRFHTKVTELFPCDKCKYLAKIETDLKKHLKIVHDKQFKCKHCPFMTNSEQQFAQHLTYHAPDCIYPCHFNGCYYRTSNTNLLANHLSQVHNLNSKHQCPICMKHYKKKTHLVRHLVSHTGERPYQCLECSERFFSHASYYRHRRKTGHDSKREGVASVPQNISIHYVDDVSANAPVKVEPDKNRFPVTFNEESTAVQEISQSTVQEVSAESQEGLDIEDILRQALANHEPGLTEAQEIIIYPDSMQASNVVLPEGNNEVVSGDKIQSLLECNGGRSIRLKQQSENGGEITYVVEYDEGEEKSKVEPAETAETRAQGDVIYQDDNVGEVQTVVEVEPPGGNQSGEQQYAILLLPSGAEPEAALSMLQLQSGGK